MGFTGLAAALFLLIWYLQYISLKQGCHLEICLNCAISVLLVSEVSYLIFDIVRTVRRWKKKDK